MLPPDKSSGVRLVEVTADRAGQRVDNFLSAQLKGLPRSAVYRMIRTGQVRISKAISLDVDRTTRKLAFTPHGDRLAAVTVGNRASINARSRVSVWPFPPGDGVALRSSSEVDGRPQRRQREVVALLHVVQDLACRRRVTRPDGQAGRHGRRDVVQQAVPRFTSRVGWPRCRGRSAGTAYA